MRQITEKDYKRIKSFEQRFYKGSDKFNEDLQERSDYEEPFMEIMKILDNAKQVSK
jgi:hypothetical protein